MAAIFLHFCLDYSAILLCWLHLDEWWFLGKHSEVFHVGNYYKVDTQQTLTDADITYIVTVFSNFIHVSLDERLDQDCHTHWEKRFLSPWGFMLIRNRSHGQVVEGLLIYVLEITTKLEKDGRMWEPRVQVSVRDLSSNKVHLMTRSHPSMFEGHERPLWLHAKTLNPAPSTTFEMLLCLRRW